MGDSFVVLLLREGTPYAWHKTQSRIEANLPRDHLISCNNAVRRYELWSDD